jgi:hypothetical protein
MFMVFIATFRIIQPSTDSHELEFRIPKRVKILDARIGRNRFLNGASVKFFGEMC